MICREQMDNPNDDGRYSLNKGRDDPNPNWCDCRQGECQYRPSSSFDPDQMFDPTQDLVDFDA